MGSEVILVQNLIHEIRGKKVMLDFDLAKLYQVETRSLNQAVKRNIKRFPPDFMFQITADEWNANSSQSVMTSNRPKMAQNVRSSVPELRLREAAVPASKSRFSSVCVKMCINHKNLLFPRNSRL